MLMFHLWGDVVWCAYGRLGPNHAVGSHFHAGPEVCELEVALGVQQHVVWLHVPDNQKKSFSSSGITSLFFNSRGI